MPPAVCIRISFCLCGARPAGGAPYEDIIYIYIYIRIDASFGFDIFVHFVVKIEACVNLHL